MTGSDASIELIRDVIQSGQLNDADVSSWLTSIALVPQPTEEILNAAKVRSFLAYLFIKDRKLNLKMFSYSPGLAASEQRPGDPLRDVTRPLVLLEARRLCAGAGRA